MHSPVRKILTQRLIDLGEFEERLNDSSMTQYERKKALKENLPADFVTERKDELQDKRYIHILMILLAVVGPALGLTQFFWYAPQTLAEMLAEPSTVAVGLGVFAVAVFFVAGGYRIHRLTNYYRRLEVYTVLHELDKANEGSTESASDASNVTAKNRELASASVAA